MTKGETTEGRVKIDPNKVIRTEPIGIKQGGGGIEFLAVIILVFWAMVMLAIENQ